MSSWSEGYVSDITYSVGFYRETTASQLVYAAVGMGADVMSIAHPKHVLELGIGMGLGFVLNAAANPGTSFEGCDFNPAHVQHAQGLASDGGLKNTTIRETSFQDLAAEAKEGQFDVDLIILHGILTWVSAEAHEAIVEIARKRLRPGGMLYISYNCMPGWAPFLPVQRLMREHAKRTGGSSLNKTSSALEMTKKVNDLQAGYFLANPTIKGRLDKMPALNASYLAHEYLNENWFIFHFADVVAMLSKAKLEYACSASITENLDSVAIPKTMLQMVTEEQDPIFKETLRDFASNKQFRRDIFVRGKSTLNQQELARAVGSIKATLAIPRSNVTFKIPGPLGELTGDPGIYGAIADALSAKDCTLAELAALPALAETGMGGVYQAIGLYMISGQVCCYFEPMGRDFATAQRFNKMIAERALRSRFYNFLAAPAVCTAIPANNLQLLSFAGVLAGIKESGALTTYIQSELRRQGMSPNKDGVVLAEPAAQQEFLQMTSKTFLTDTLPIWRRLGVMK